MVCPGFVFFRAKVVMLTDKKTKMQHSVIICCMERHIIMSTTQPIRNLKELNNFKNYYRDVDPNPRNYALIILGLNTALRISDILALRQRDVYDAQNRRWRSHIEVTEQKTGKHSRIYVNREIKRVLTEYRCIQWPGDSCLFPSQKNKNAPISRYQAFRIVRKAAERSGLSAAHISCHSLRKTFGYQAWKQGTPPALLMDIYNHSAYQITRRYLCIDQDDRDSVFANTVL